MPKRPRKKRAPARRARRAAPPAASSLVVQFLHAEDPSTEQTEVVRDLVRKFARKARVAREIPGALRVEIRADSEDAFRREVDALPDWDVASEGAAEMPPSPLSAELEDDEKLS